MEGLHVAIIIIVLLCVIVLYSYFTSEHNDFVGKYIKDGDQLYEETYGDEPNATAKEALKKLVAKITESESASANKNGKEKNNDKAQPPTPQDYFRIGNLYRYQFKNPKLATDNYKKAIKTIIQQPQQLVNNTNRVGVDGNKVNTAINMHVINNVEDYINQLQLAELMDGFNADLEQARLATMTTVIAQTRVTPPAPTAQTVRTNLNHLNPPHNQVNQQGVVQNDRLRNNLRYFNEIERVPVNTQNVHDSQVNRDIIKSYEKIKQYNQLDMANNRKVNLESCKDFIKTNGSENANKVLKKIMEKNLISNLNAREDDILLEIWKRIHSPVNKENINSLKIALLDALENSVEHGTVVCAQGRTSRLIASLALIDKDPELGVTKTQDILNVEALSKASTILQNELTSLSLNNPSLYDKYNNSVDDEETQQLIIGIKNKIRMDLETNYKNIIPADKLEHLLQECYAGV